LPIGLLKAREAVMGHFRPMLRRHGFTEQQWRVIRVLGEHGSCDATQLARSSCINPPSLTRILRDLEGALLLTARASKTDTRRLEVRLSARGRATYTGIAGESESIYRRLQRALGPGRLQRCMKELHHVTIRLTQLTAPE
jgi:homoprotocatechuate degradation regulator HpaR